MAVRMLADGVLAVLVVGWIVYRQLTWRAADVPRMLRWAAILAGVGVAMTAGAGRAGLSGAAELLALLAELTLSTAVGALMGRIAVFRPMPDAAARGLRWGRRPAAAVPFQTRTGWLGLALWVVLLAVRVGVDAVAALAGAHPTGSAGVILLVVAVNRAARAGVIHRRLSALPATGMMGP